MATSGATTTTTAYYGGFALSDNGALSYLLSDGLGSVTASVSASSGAVTATQLYSPYGSVRSQSGTLPTDYGFTHQRSDASTSGLDYYGARYYDPLAGQFTSADTTLAGGLNRYAYVGGNPETRTDPSGHIYANPRDWERATAMREAQQPAQVYVNQWAAPGTVGGFVTYVGQAVFATDTLKQTLHTLVDPHASLGDKAKAAGVFGFVAASDLVTIGSSLGMQPEVGAEVCATQEAVLAAADLEHVAVASDASLAATDAGVAGDLTGAAGSGGGAGATAGAATGASKDIAWITPGSLLPAEESSLNSTLGYIDSGTTPSGALATKWGTPFKNLGGDLPGGVGAQSSPYLEYRVAPPPGTVGAGLLRVVFDPSSGEMYYTWTHYGGAGDPAFVRIR